MKLKLLRSKRQVGDAGDIISSPAFSIRRVQPPEGCRGLAGWEVGSPTSCWTFVLEDGTDAVEVA